MIFTEFRFLGFFLLVFVVHWSLRSLQARKVWLLASSYMFYAAWDWRFLSLIWISTAVDYWVGIELSKTEDSRLRRRWLLLSILVNLGMLGFFKYCNFFIESASDLASVLGVPVSLHTLAIVLPVGISFYTFQTMSYSIDVYRKKMQARRSLLDLAVFVGFFPQLVAGPIVRAREFIPQLEEPRRWSAISFRPLLVLFLVGYFKKACISDNIAPTVDAYFASPDLYTAASAWVGVLLYSVQVYCDFSGYSDMAIACAGLLGYRLCLNFDFPYLSSSITDLWRRWHISFSSWLRDYVYIPLGGSRGGLLFTYRNIMLTMLLGGLWHGAAWRFVLWGALNGVGLVVHKEWTRWYSREHPGGWFRSVVGVALTYYWFCLALIFFRSIDFQSTLTTVRAYVLCEGAGDQTLPEGMPILLVLLAVVHIVARQRPLEKVFQQIPAVAFAALYGVMWYAVIALTPFGAQPFIYFQF